MNKKSGLKRPLPWPKNLGKESHAVKNEPILWSEKHAPKSTTDLAVCIHNGTVNKVREWIEMALSPQKQIAKIVNNGSNSSFKMPPPPPKRLLILCGSAGVGKSSVVRCLGKELGIELSEWNDNFGQVQTWKNRDDDALIPDSSRIDSEYSFGQDSNLYVSQIAQFEKFLHSGTYESLGRILQFKSRTGGGSDRTAVQTTQHKLHSRRTLLLIESLPTFGESKGCSVDRLRQSIQSFLNDSTASPAILIFSDVAEKNECAPALERFLSRDIMMSPLVECIEFNPITAKKCAKRLIDILRKEHLGQALSSDDVDTISERSAGDLRAAINDLQFRSARGKQKHSRIKDRIIQSQTQSNSQSSTQSKGKGNELESRGDVRISSVHCIAKIIHGSKNGFLEEWDAEALAGQCEMGVDAMASFLQHNAVEFYSECDELADGMQSLSDADLFISRQFDTSHTRDHGDTTFPEQYSISISARAVSATNKHPDGVRMKAFKPIKKSNLHETHKRKGLNDIVNKQRVSMCTDMSTSVSTSATADVMSYINMFNLPRMAYPGITPGSEMTRNDTLQQSDTPTGHIEDIDEFD